ncbi:hypothetical protein J4416_02115 [Candidatus Pacearchaeota archaeon]|nr:hypothetical protein [Candidatus Pacearchaeota archaeon]
MKLLIWVIVAIVVVGGLAWFLSADKSESSSQQQQQTDNAEQLSEDGRIISTDEDVFSEIDDALNTLE